MGMNLKDILDALKGASAEEKAAFAKALEPGQAPAAGLTKEQLDKALEPFAKGAGSPADFGAPAQTAQLDVTGWIQQVTASITDAAKKTHENQDVLMKGFKTLGDFVKSLAGEVEELKKGLTAPGKGQAVVNSFAKGGAMPGAGADGGHVVQPHNEGGAGRWENMTEAQVVGHLQQAFSAEQDPMKKGRIADAIAQVELDYAISDDFFAKLGVAEPKVG